MSSSLLPPPTPPNPLTSLPPSLLPSLHLRFFFLRWTVCFPTCQRAASVLDRPSFHLLLGEQQTGDVDGMDGERSEDDGGGGHVNEQLIIKKKNTRGLSKVTGPVAFKGQELPDDDPFTHCNCNRHTHTHTHKTRLLDIWITVVQSCEQNHIIWAQKPELEGGR